MFPFASLPENLAAFGSVLRHQYGFRVGVRHVQDALRVLAIAPIADERAIRNLWRPILSSTADEAAMFDRAFDAFFHHRTRSALERERTTDSAFGETNTSRQKSGERRRDHERLGDDSATHESPSNAIVDVETVDDRADERDDTLRSSYSPIEGEAQAPDIEPADRVWRDAALAFVRRVQTALSRRWQPAARGARFDLRRTLRSSLHTGGEALSPRWRARPRLRPRFVVIVDGSRSMSPYAEATLRSAVALATATSNVETFVFSTELRRITAAIRRAASGQRMRLPPLEHAWGGGTGIGNCLRDFLHRFGERLLSRDSVVIIASDGLDVGHPEVLRRAMTDLRRRAAAVIWLNPLLDTLGYEPTSIGMRTARPSVTTLAWVGDAAALHRLARLVRVN
jgi:uncharacterized protein with von Willebrand factor type A (vWA) domain